MCKPLAWEKREEKQLHCHLNCWLRHVLWWGNRPDVRGRNAPWRPTSTRLRPWATWFLPEPSLSEGHCCRESSAEWDILHELLLRDPGFKLRIMCLPVAQNLPPVFFQSFIYFNIFLIRGSKPRTSRIQARTLPTKWYPKPTPQLFKNIVLAL